MSEDVGQEILTPYHFGLNNPIRYNDPTGKCIPCALPLIDVAKSILIAAFAYHAGTTIAENIDVQNVQLPAINSEGFGSNDFIPLSAQMVRDKYHRSVGRGGSQTTTASDNLVPAPIEGELTLVPSGTFTTIKGSQKNDRENSKIYIDPENKIPRDQLNPPNKPGNAPRFKKDGKPVEIHHEQQSPNGPYKEMHPTDHRRKGNDKINHPKKNEKSQIDRKEWDKQRKQYWKNEFPKDK